MRWKCGCSYDGTDFFGWQTQDGQLSVQQVLVEALERVFKESVQVFGSGRTDAGVHAREQVFHFDFDWKHGPFRLKRALQTYLPPSIQILYAEEVADDFHARFSAKSKIYQYQLHRGIPDPFLMRYCWDVRESIDLNAMNDALAYLIGERDFAAFAANRGVEYESTIRTMTRAEIVQDDRLIRIVFQADGFLYKMARSLVGTLVNVGSGRLEPIEVKRLLESGKRIPMVYVAPPHGLFLEKALY